MAKLIFLLDGNVIKEFMLDRERMTIGRRPTCDIHIDNLAISGEHAVIITSENEVILQDMNSTNGSLVNQKPVTKHVLEHGDIIGLGKYSLKFVKDGQAGIAHSDGFADTVMVPVNETAEPVTEIEATNEKDNADIEMPVVEEEQNADTAESANHTVNVEDVAEVDLPVGSSETAHQTMPPRLNILNGDNAGTELMLDKSMVKIGEPGQQVAVITKRKDGFYITHVSGDAFPSINDATIGAQANMLNHLDVIEVLGVKMEVRLD